MRYHRTGFGDAPPAAGMVLAPAAPSQTSASDFFNAALWPVELVIRGPFGHDDNGQIIERLQSRLTSGNPALMLGTLAPVALFVWLFSRK